VRLRAFGSRGFFEENWVFFSQLWISLRAVRRGLAVVLASVCLQATAAQSGVAPAPRTDRNSQIAHEQLVEKARRGGIDAYFVGDSITRRWGTSDAQYREFLDNWRRNFFGWNAANFGWGADTVQNVLWRVSNGELDGVNPKVIVLLAGTNNVGNAPRDGVDAATADVVVRGIDAIVSVMRAKAPDATIVLTGVTPRRDRNGGTTLMPTIDAINGRLQSLADGRRIRYVDINGRLASRDGVLVDGVTVDGLHLSAAGYQIWADALKPIFTALLGPPASTDHAPPPTGDPGVR
jgi:lysophospholipase L1-like esterase